MYIVFYFYILGFFFPYEVINMTGKTVPSDFCRGNTAGKPVGGSIHSVTCWGTRNQCISWEAWMYTVYFVRQTVVSAYREGGNQCGASRKKHSQREAVSYSSGAALPVPLCTLKNTVVSQTIPLLHSLLCVCWWDADSKKWSGTQLRRQRAAQNRKPGRSDALYTLEQTHKVLTKG